MMLALRSARQLDGGANGSNVADGSSYFFATQSRNHPSLTT